MLIGIAILLSHETCNAAARTIRTEGGMFFSRALVAASALLGILDGAAGCLRG